MDDVNVSPNDASWQNDKLDDYLVHRTYNVHGVEDERRWRGAESTRKGKQLAKVAEKEKGDCRRLWVAGEERGFLACSLDMGQEINGTSNTDANSVNQVAQATAHVHNVVQYTRMYIAPSTSNRCKILFWGTVFALTIEFVHI